MINILDVDGFEWDSGNWMKNYHKHSVTSKEAEEVFNNFPLFFEKGNNEKMEERFIAYGRTNSEKFLTIVYAVRKNKIRIISARPQSRKERKAYNEEAKKAIEANSGI